MSSTGAVVLLSGGLDSATALGIACAEHDKVYALSFMYGQRHEAELEAARALASHYGVDGHHILRIPLFQADSVLMNPHLEMPHMTYEELEQSEGVSPTYVPFRNGTFLSFAAGLALQKNASAVYAGMHGEDARGWAYPDCTPEFAGAMQNAIYVGTYHKVRMIVPFQYLLKHEIVNLGLKLGVPYELTLSCYEGTVPACGQCPTCIGRIEAFKKNGVEDPIPYLEPNGQLKLEV